MRSAQPVIHYLVGVRALHWHGLAGQSLPRIGLPINLSALREVIGEKQKPGETLVARPALTYLYLSVKYGVPVRNCHYVELTTFNCCSIDFCLLSSAALC